MIENIKLMTRSTASDYEFFGRETSTAWLQKYQQRFFDDTSANGLTLFGEIENSEWKLFVGRIPSSNRDSFTRQLSYILKSEGTRGNSDSLLMAKLVTFILKSDFEMNTIGEKFSSEFTTDYINGLDDKRHTQETEAEINEKLERIFQSINIALPEVAKDIDGLSFDYFSAKKAETISRIIALVSDKETAIDGKILFAVTMLPIEAKDTDSIFAESDNIRGLVLTTDKDYSDPLPIVKKKSKNRMATEFPTTSRNGWSKTPKILMTLLIISLMLNCILIGSRSSHSGEKASSLMAKQDSLNVLKNSVAAYADSIMTLNTRIEKIKALQHHGGSWLDVVEFNKTGFCKVVSTKHSDTVAVYSIVDFAKSNCEVRIYNNGVAKGSTTVNFK